MYVTVIYSIYKIPSYRVVSKLEHIEGRQFCYFEGKYGKGVYYCLKGFLDDRYRLLNVGYLLTSGKIRGNQNSLKVVIYDVKTCQMITSRNGKIFKEIYETYYKEFGMNDKFFYEFRD